MNFLEDPEPYSSFDTNPSFASFSLFDETTTNTVSDYKSVPTQLRFSPNIPIPPLPEKKILLNTDCVNAWLTDIPKSIKLKQTVHITFTETNRRITDTLPTLPKLKRILEMNIMKPFKQPIQIIIDLQYSLRLKIHSFCTDCISVETSIGENSKITNLLLKKPSLPPPIYPESQPITNRNGMLIQPRRTYHPFRNRTTRQTTLRDHFNVRSLIRGDLEQMLTNLIQSQQQPMDSDDISPQPTYNEQMDVLDTMGFTNRQQNEVVLRRAFGNVNRAVELLLGDNLITNSDGYPTDDEQTDDEQT